MYESGKITRFKENYGGYSAVVLGAHPYHISVSNRHYDHGSCDCYLGQRDTLYKHMVAVAIHAVLDGKPFEDEDKEVISSPECSGKLGELSKEDLSNTKKVITQAIRYIKPYNGPSRIWFAYQGFLDEGCAKLSKIVSELSVSKQTADLLVNMFLRLDKKLCTGGVDDSNGTARGFIEKLAIALIEYVKLDLSCIDSFEKLCNQGTCFDWEAPLVRMYDEKDMQNNKIEKYEQYKIRKKFS